MSGSRLSRPISLERGGGDLRDAPERSGPRGRAAQNFEAP